MSDQKGFGRHDEPHQMTLGEVIDALQRLADKNAPVGFDFEYAYPTTLASWRGSYYELAIGFGVGGCGPSVTELLGRLDAAIGQDFEGYKGGLFGMGRSTPLWVSNWGHAGHTVIVGVSDTEWAGVVLHTRYCDFD